MVNIWGSGGTIKFLGKIFLLFFPWFALKMQHQFTWGGLFFWKSVILSHPSAPVNLLESYKLAKVRDKVKDPMFTIYLPYLAFIPLIRAWCPVAWSNRCKCGVVHRCLKKSTPNSYMLKIRLWFMILFKIHIGLRLIAKIDTRWHKPTDQPYSHATCFKKRRKLNRAGLLVCVIECRFYLPIEGHMAFCQNLD